MYCQMALWEAMTLIRWEVAAEDQNNLSCPGSHIQAKEISGDE